MKVSQANYHGKAVIKNIIFDWGGVITTLHLDATRKAFQQLGLVIFDESVPHNPHDTLFIPFETGKISPGEFRTRLRQYAVAPLTDEEIDKAWNAMLGELPVERWKLLEKAGKCYRTFLLSNTNAIHLPYYFEYLHKIYGTKGYTHLFEKSYFSHELGLRKPDAEIFQHVMQDAGILPDETLFIDDFIENIEAARRLGFQTIHLTAPLTLVDLFENGSD
jgi:FMN phosphatase YigB (HAD superfamily)